MLWAFIAHPFLLPKDIFRNIDNTLTQNTSEAKGIDYFEFQGLLCERFEILSLDSFEFMFNDYILRVQIKV